MKLAEKTKRKTIGSLDMTAKIELSTGKDPMGLAITLDLSCVKNGR